MGRQSDFANISRRQFLTTSAAAASVPLLAGAVEARPGAATTGDAGKTMTVQPKPGERFSIPYSVLVPRGWKNLWAAGRCLSADVVAHGSASTSSPVSTT